jgi:hypothetical protein
MSYIFYKDLISEISLKLHYQSTVHLLGRDYSDESVLDFVNSSNPIMIDLDKKIGEIKKGTDKPKVTLGLLKDFGMFDKK